jgi:toxin CptA
VQFPITIGLHRSCFLDRAVLAIALVASSVILVFPRSTAILAGILLLTWVGAAVAWWQLKPALSKLRLLADGRFEVLPIGAAEFQPIRCLPGATVHPWLTVVRIEMPDSQRFTLLLTVDTMSQDAFRRLRVFLRWRADLDAQSPGGP